MKTFNIEIDELYKKLAMVQAAYEIVTEERDDARSKIFERPGWVLVPRQPTDLLSARLARCHVERLNDNGRRYAKKVWREYLEIVAAPETGG